MYYTKGSIQHERFDADMSASWCATLASINGPNFRDRDTTVVEKGKFAVAEEKHGQLSKHPFNPS